MIALELKKQYDFIFDIKNFSRKRLDFLKKEIKLTAFEITTDAKENAPVDTGRLSASLHPEFISTKSYTYSDNKGRTFNGKLTSISLKDDYTAVVGSNVNYASFVEENHKTKRHFLENAFKKNVAEFKKRINEK